MMKLDEAIAYLRKGVKYSAVEGQKHIDPALFPVNESALYDEAMKSVRLAVKNGEITEALLKTRLGLD